MRIAAVVIGLVAALTACDQPGGRLHKVTPTTTARSSSLTVPTRHTITSTVPKEPPQVVPDPASHKACRWLDWHDLPADVRPAGPSPHVTYTDSPDQCRIDNSLLGVGTEDGNLLLMARTVVSGDLAPIEQFAETTEKSTGKLITINSHRAVERIWGDPVTCAIYLDVPPEPFGVAITNTRFPKYTPCDLAGTLASAILSRYR